MLLLLALLISDPISAAAVVVAGINTRRVTTGPGLPWILEADWQQALPEAAGMTRQRHDPLSSCYWPAAAALAELVADLSIPGEYLEIGCGTGLLSLTAAMHGATVLATDVSQTSLDFTSAAADAQGLSIRTRIFDAMNLVDPLPEAECLLLSDVFVTDELATAIAARVAEACAAGSAYRRVFVVDPGRSTRRTFLDALSERGVAVGDGFLGADDCRARARAGRTQWRIHQSTSYRDLAARQRVRCYKLPQAKSLR